MQLMHWTEYGVANRDGILMYVVSGKDLLQISATSRRIEEISVLTNNVH